MKLKESDPETYVKRLELMLDQTEKQKKKEQVIQRHLSKSHRNRAKLPKHSHHMSLQKPLTKL